MKVRVIKAFSDMYTHKMVVVGSIIEVDDKRGADIVSRGYGESIEEVSIQPEAPEEGPEPAPAEVEEKPKKRNSRKKKE